MYSTRGGAPEEDHVCAAGKREGARWMLSTAWRRCSAKGDDIWQSRGRKWCTSCRDVCSISLQEKTLSSQQIGLVEIWCLNKPAQNFEIVRQETKVAIELASGSDDCAASRIVQRLFFVLLDVEDLQFVTRKLNCMSQFFTTQSRRMMETSWRRTHRE